MNILTRPDAPPASPGWQSGDEQRLVLCDVAWADYLAIGNALRDRGNVRLTYDRGMLEIMTTSPRHEIWKKWLDYLLQLLIEECGLARVTAGNMTFQREDLERGLEPDDCYWIAHEPQMRGRLDYDIERDPPPDLVIEIEVSRGAMNRMGTYARLRVPEVWRFDGDAIHVHVLDASGNYEQTERSPTFPKIAIQGMVPYLQPDPQQDSLTVSRSFRAWVREQLAEL
ncbi:MAG: Uma2 family endonuclease [Gemmataceae bacterium]|nr:Uma2 family endonuclease [Gemmataceae bacterium]